LVIGSKSIHINYYFYKLIGVRIPAVGWKPKPGKKPFLPINTHDDSLVEKPMWKKPFIKSRCIVPASGFYEWSGKKGNKTPHYIYPVNEKLIGFAGIFSDLAPEDKQSTRSTRLSQPSRTR